MQKEQGCKWNTGLRELEPKGETGASGALSNSKLEGGNGNVRINTGSTAEGWNYVEFF